jgi:CRISPR-associated exonuclease Cas4
MLPFLTGLLLLLFAVILFIIAGRQQRRTGLPSGRVIYTDTGDWGKLEKPLYDRDLGLVGKPDYLVEHKGLIIPVEVKSGRTPQAPYDSHIFQLAAYCLLVHQAYGRRPAYGIIHYPERDFAVDYTPGLEKALKELIEEMRRDEHRSEIPPSHRDAARCRHCGYRAVCDQRLA